MLVIDNDADGSAASVVEAHRRRIAALGYVVETRKGIPVARNRAVDEALASGADALVFIDDDEYPRRDWLSALVSCWRQGGAELLGGPVAVAPAPEGASRWGRFVNASLSARAERRNRMTAASAASGSRYTIVTNNWLCDLGWLRRTGLRFDERLLMTGGSDTEFFRSARALGCRTRWCPQALVYEISEPERLTLSYQLFRAASQSMNHFRMKERDLGAGLVAATVTIAALRAVLGAALLVVPVLGLASPVVAVRSIGWSAGRIQALFGRRSRLYE
jgi:glycosyltransferase involved in cell wall biosynthesis